MLIFKRKIAFPVKDKIDTDINKVFSRIPKENKVV